MTPARKFSAREAAEFLGLSPSLIRRALLRGTLKAEKVGQGWVIYESDLVRFQAKPRKVGPPFGGTRPRKIDPG